MKPEAARLADATKAVGIWIRVSTEDQARGESPEHHERRAHAYAEAKGWQVREVYHLEAVSGKSVLGHPEAERMLKDVREGRITGLIFSKLARNTRELLDLADRFREYEADLISLQESIDTSSPAGRLFYTMIAAMAQWEREEIAERVAASVPIRAKLGKPLGGAAPFGYRWEARELVPAPNEAPIRKLLYDLFLEHRRKKTVARLLNDAGHRTRNGSKWTDTTVDRLLRDPTAKGLRKANYTRSTGDKKHWVLKPEADWVFSEVEAIVSEEIWERANAILDARRKTGKGPARRTVHLFAGLVFCHCGGKMSVPSNSPKYICPKCRNKIPTDDLEAVFREQLKAFVFSPGDIAEYLTQADEEMKKKEDLLGVLEGERGKLTREMDRVMQLYLSDQISKDGFGREYRPMEERLKQLEDQIPALQGELDFFRIQHLSRDEVVVESQDLASRWSDLTQDEKRELVENITERITVGTNEVQIEVFHLPFVGKTVAERQRSAMAALPSCHWLLRGSKPRGKNYPQTPKSLGDHLKRCRLDLGLRQEDVAAQIRVTAETICHWELGQHEPPVRLIPAIHTFLGFCPINPAWTLGERLRAAREARGLSRRRVAGLVGLDEGTVARAEQGIPRMARRSVTAASAIFTVGGVVKLSTKAGEDQNH